MANVTVTKSTTAKLNHQTTLYQKLPCTKKIHRKQYFIGMFAREKYIIRKINIFSVYLSIINNIIAYFEHIHYTYEFNIDETSISCVCVSPNNKGMTFWECSLRNQRYDSRYDAKFARRWKSSSQILLSF